MAIVRLFFVNYEGDMEIRGCLMFLSYVTYAVVKLVIIVTEVGYFFNRGLF